MREVSMKNTVGVVVGRFQLDTPHDGHIRLLDHVHESHPKMLILLGVRPAEVSDTNPLNFEVREKMLRELCPHATILPVIDCRSDEVWSAKVDELIQTVYGPDTAVVFHVGRKSFAPHYKGKHPIQEHTFGEVDEMSGTKIRERIRDELPTTKDGRHGAIHAIMNMRDRYTLMVDMFLVRWDGDPLNDGKGSYKILVGKKDGEDEWRLPGGGVDSDESFKAAASRELAEETGMHLTDGWEGWKIVGDYDVPDWRVRDTDRITYKTVLMVGEYSWGKARAGTDLVEVEWIHVDEIFNSGIVEEHVHLFQAAIKFLEKNPPYFITNPPERLSKSL